MNALKKVLLAVILLALLFGLKFDMLRLEKSEHIRISGTFYPESSPYTWTESLKKEPPYNSGSIMLSDADRTNENQSFYTESENPSKPDPKTEDPQRMTDTYFMDAPDKSPEVAQDLIPVFDRTDIARPASCELPDSGEASKNGEWSISIVQISLMGENTEGGMEEFETQNLRKVRGIRLTDNDIGTHYNLVIQSRYSDGTETLQYLPWDEAQPDVYTLFGPLGIEASVTVCENEKPVSLFALDPAADDEIVQLSLNIDDSAPPLSLDFLAMDIVAK